MSYIPDHGLLDAIGHRVTLENHPVEDLCRERTYQIAANLERSLDA
ncbi:hypothetical protein [Longibacter salinarum]|nr:hypothetical protein [Longibacter salinarum]